MRGTGKEAAIIAAKRQKYIETAYELFSSKNIDSVSLQDIAKETGLGLSMLYRYFENKQTLVVEAATWGWNRFREENIKRQESLNYNEMTAAEAFEFYLDSFLVLYRDYKDMLRFNQFFNVYVQAENIDAGTLQPYQDMIAELKDRFHDVYVKGEQDHTIRTDEPEEKMFTKTIHLMLAVVTRYAVGLVYTPKDGSDPEEEILFQKNMMLRAYTTKCR